MPILWKKVEKPFCKRYDNEMMGLLVGLDFVYTTFQMLYPTQIVGTIFKIKS